MWYIPIDDWLCRWSICGFESFIIEDGAGATCVIATLYLSYLSYLKKFKSKKMGRKAIEKQQTDSVTYV